MLSMESVMRLQTSGIAESSGCRDLSILRSLSYRRATCAGTLALNRHRGHLRDTVTRTANGDDRVMTALPYSTRVETLPVADAAQDVSSLVLPTARHDLLGPSSSSFASAPAPGTSLSASAAAAATGTFASTATAPSAGRMPMPVHNTKQSAVNAESATAPFNPVGLSRGAASASFGDAELLTSSMESDAESCSLVADPTGDIQLLCDSDPTHPISLAEEAVLHPLLPSNLLQDIEAKLEADLKTICITILFAVGFVSLEFGINDLIEHYWGDSILTDVACIGTGLVVVFWVRLSKVRLMRFDRWR